MIAHWAYSLELGVGFLDGFVPGFGQEEAKDNESTAEPESHFRVLTEDKNAQGNGNYGAPVADRAGDGGGNVFEAEIGEKVGKN